jgi:hypothetical protein
MEPWLVEARNRLRINEGSENRRYWDSVGGVWSIGIGFNLARSDAAFALQHVGSSMDVIERGEALTDGQVDALFEYSFSPVVNDARALLAMHVFNHMSDARKCAWCDMCYNMGRHQLSLFFDTIALINAAELSRVPANKHMLYHEVSDHVLTSGYASQVGNRAKRNAAMLRSSVYADPNGDGSDV